MYEQIKYLNRNVYILLKVFSVTLLYLVLLHSANLNRKLLFVQFEGFIPFKFKSFC